MIKYGKVDDLVSVSPKADVLSTALPYLKRYKGKTVVIKLSGELLIDEAKLESFARDIVLLSSVGVKIVLCHGGGAQISKEMEAIGLAPKFIDGQRITCKQTLDVAARVLLGDLNRKIVSKINSFDPVAIGLSGIDANIITVKQKDKKFGQVGTIDMVLSEPLKLLLDGGYIPVISSLGSDNNGDNYNINADAVAGEVSKALKAEKLILLTNTSGIYEDFSKKEKFISEIDVSSLKTLIEKDVVVDGMIPKVEAIIVALRGGVGRAHIIDGRLEHALLIEVFTEEGIGTMIIGG